MSDAIMQLRYSILKLCAAGRAYWKPRVPCRLFMLINKQGENLGESSWSVVLWTGCFNGSYATALLLNFYGRVTIAANNKSKCLDIFKRNLFKVNLQLSFTMWHHLQNCSQYCYLLFLWALSTRCLMTFRNCGEAKALTMETQILNDISLLQILYFWLFLDLLFWYDIAIILENNILFSYCIAS